MNFVAVLTLNIRTTTVPLIGNHKLTAAGFSLASQLNFAKGSIGAIDSFNGLAGHVSRHGGVITNGYKYRDWQWFLQFISPNNLGRNRGLVRNRGLD
jgi:hypothetical protein